MVFSGLKRSLQQFTELIRCSTEDFFFLFLNMFTKKQGQKFNNNNEDFDF